METGTKDTSARRTASLDSRPRRRAFTITELLVVMAILALLTGILWPAAQQAGRHARAAACQCNLRQWNLAFAAFGAENENWFAIAEDDWEPFYRRYGDGPRRTLLLCPMATRYRVNEDFPLWEYGETINCGVGSKFTAWKLATRNMVSSEPGPVFGSYAINGPGLSFLDLRVRRAFGVRRNDVSCVPLLMDSASWFIQPDATNEPPAYDGELDLLADMRRACINRHSGGINCLFLDWSVRKVALKELWTLRWSPWFDTHGPWTSAGGVRPEDWPQWMRRCKDD
jgi:prepilin-type N-terminal cleavage/methylation domain-containing protein/prepilin-type processing-associated H-X9-DG protein